MNIIRLFLYAALGAVSLALWNAWQTDYPPLRQTEIVANRTTDVKSAQHVDYKNLKAEVPARRIVTVRTDVLDVAIDTLGGNVVRAKLLKYPISVTKSDTPIQLFNDIPEKLYTADSALSSDIGPDSGLDGQTQYSVLQQNYNLTPDQKEIIVQLTWNKDGLFITKSFTFTRGKYDIKVAYNIDNRTGRTWNGNFSAIIQHKSLPDEKAGGLFHFRTFTGAAISSPGNTYEKLSYSSMDKENLSRTISGGWLAFQQQYFLSAWIPDQHVTNNYFSKVVDDQVYVLGFSENIKVPNKTEATVGAKLYVGPEITANLKALAKNLDHTVDYGWFWFISIGLFWVLQQIYKVIGNWGWAIIILTGLIKLAFYKFSEKSYRSMAKMREMAPRLQSLKERFGSDRQKLQQATIELYRKEKVNPLGGCLPIVIQIPVFIALYYVLVEAVELRQAPFMFWIHDLSIRDPYYTLPILMGLSMLLQQRLNPAPPDPTQAKIMMFLPIIFTVFFLSFPAGLVLYWLVNNCLSILQQWYIMRQVAKVHKKPI
jgi:YidC/Oxa1 family membrane protein insertase